MKPARRRILPFRQKLADTLAPQVPQVSPDPPPKSPPKKRGRPKKLKGKA